ncbi:MAG: STAS domain-containing protein, partial [Spirochaetes bacterium]|nr:STAS domain-containing protein [Spirochaetota bacterium]
MGKKREDYIIKISGDFDINTFHRLKTLKKSIFGAIHNNKKRLIIDMGKVTYIDSSGIGLLFMAKEKIYK